MIFLISNDVISLKLDDELKILRYFDIKNILYFNDEYFKIDYLKDLLYNEDYYHVINVNNKLLTYKILTKTKSKILKKIESSKLNINDFINENKIKLCLVHGISSSLKKIKINPHLLFNKNLSNDEIFYEFYKKDMLEKHKKLIDILSLINNEKTMHRVIFGKDLINAINYNQIKTLFCSPKKIKKIYKNFNNDLLNFEIIEIKSLEKGDIGEELKTKFKGIIGYTYY